MVYQKGLSYVNIVRAGEILTKTE